MANDYNAIAMQQERIRRMDRTKHTAVASPGTLEDKILATNLWRRLDYTCSAIVLVIAEVATARGR